MPSAVLRNSTETIHTDIINIVILALFCMLWVIVGQKRVQGMLGNKALRENKIRKRETKKTKKLTGEERRVGVVLRTTTDMQFPT
jgi:hypothetical protein